MYKRRTELRNQPHLRVPHSELLHRIWWSPRLSLRWNEGDINYRTAVEAEGRFWGASCGSKQLELRSPTTLCSCLFIFSYMYAHWGGGIGTCRSQKHLPENACRELNSSAPWAQYTRPSHHLSSPHQLFPKLLLAFHPQGALCLHYKKTKGIYHLYPPWFAFLTAIRRSKESSGIFPRDLGLGV